MERTIDGTAAWPAKRCALQGLALAATILLGACGASPDPDPSQRAAADGRPTADSCADDGARLPLTGLCAGRAVNYLNVAEGDAASPPEGCEWVVQETQFATDVLLYRAAKCGEDPAIKLEYAGGAQTAELKATGGWSHTIRVASADAADPNASILRIALPAVEDAAERARCKVRRNAADAWPKDALFVDSFTPEEAAKPEEDGPRSACGPFGYNGDEASYWRVFQGHVWFFQMGQEAQAVDAGSLTLMTKEPDGSWTQVQ